MLKGASMNVGRGESVGLIGKNGSGKSTLLRIVSRILSCDNGSITWNGQSLMGSDVRLRKSLLYLGHEPGFYPPLSALENLQFLAGLYGLEMSSEQITEKLGEVGLNVYQKGPIRNYSRGMLQRLLLAKALLITWDLLLMDEPTSGLDTDGKGILSKVIKLWRDEGRSLFIISHNERWISAHVDRINVLENGKIEAREGKIESRGPAEMEEEP
ncbi:MAG: ABC transporter ATP-binding protein [Candidatus Neomarinimicrobiota bacterium]|nr:ABC transporter ATP-binding protein [Candidatus Neomarinimicrobiota bacterium]